METEDIDSGKGALVNSDIVHSMTETKSKRCNYEKMPNLLFIIMNNLVITVINKVIL